MNYLIRRRKGIMIAVYIVTIISLIAPLQVLRPVLAQEVIPPADETSTVAPSESTSEAVTDPLTFVEITDERTVPTEEPVTEEPVVEEPATEPPAEEQPVLEVLSVEDPGINPPRISIQPIICGNGILDPSEQCDDGNLVNKDGCNDQCQLETGDQCDLDTTGWWAYYYNYSRSHPDMNMPDEGDNWPDDGHGAPMTAGWDTDWYDSQYYRFSRVDSNLSFGDNFFPFDFAKEETDEGHEYHFGARWRATVTAPTEGDYSYMLRTDDDSWVYIDGILFDQLPGIHAPQTSPTTVVHLTAGEHTFDVFFAERHIYLSAMTLELDQALTIVPAPLDCNQCVSPLDYVDNNGTDGSGPDQQHGLSDAVMFTAYYKAGDPLADVNFDQVVDIKDYLCANKYYSTGLYECPIDCSNICVNPLDYDTDYDLGIDDATVFTGRYGEAFGTSIGDPKWDATVDINGNGTIDYGDYACSIDYIGNGDYQCTIKCEATCGDTVVQKRLQEQCDDGNNVDGDGCSATCQNEQICQGTGTYTYDADFDKGALINVTHTPSDQLQLDQTVSAFNFIWVAVSGNGTIVKMDTNSGAVLGQYKTSPDSHGWGNPSRTTVDKDGSVWVGNRNGVYDGNGSITHVGLVENGQCVDKNSNGIIDTSVGYGDIKSWTNVSGTNGVGSADDECIIHYTRINNPDARHISVDANNNVWVSGYYGRNFDLVKGGSYGVAGSGTIIRSESSVGYGGYGGLIDSNNVIWSANNLLRWDTTLPLTGPNGVNWTGYGHDSYGLCIDSQGNVWNTSLYNNQIRKFAPDGTLLGTFGHGSYYAQGCAVDKNDHVWVASSILDYSNTVGHLLNDGTFIGNVAVGSQPTGVSVDANGKVWATNHTSQTVSRINPLGGAIGADGITPIGAVDFTSQDLGGVLYNYSDMTGSTLTGSANSGTWTVIHDGQVSGIPWQNITWNALGSLTVTVATSEDGTTFGAPLTITNGQDLSALTARYLKIVVTFEREVTGASPILYDLTATRLCEGGAICGNDTVEEPEQCDDGNTNNGDGCSAQCIIEQNGSNCGNQSIDSGEQCDDGNTNSGDGCTATCQLEYDIHGFKWDDVNQNGTHDCPFLREQFSQLSDIIVGACEQKLAGWTIFLDGNDNGVLDQGETSTTTSDGSEHYGWYWFNNLPAGNYSICEVIPNGWNQTYPGSPAAPTCHDVTLPEVGGLLSLNAVEAPEHNFGNVYVGGPFCGDGIINGQEVCDNGDANGDGVDQCKLDCSGYNRGNIDPTPTGGGGGGGGSYVQTTSSLKLEKVATAPAVEPGSKASYTISITNTGNQIGTNLTITDTLPAGFTFEDGTITKTWTYDTIGVGQVISFSYIVNVNANNVTGTYINTAVASVTNGTVYQATAPVEVRKAGVLGIELPTVLGFEELPNTNGGMFSWWELMLMVLAITSMTALGLRASANSITRK